MRIDAISIGKNPPHDVNVIIEEIGRASCRERV